MRPISIEWFFNWLSIRVGGSKASKSKQAGVRGKGHWADSKAKEIRSTIKWSSPKVGVASPGLKTNPIKAVSSVTTFGLNWLNPSQAYIGLRAAALSASPTKDPASPSPMLWSLEATARWRYNLKRTCRGQCLKSWGLPLFPERLRSFLFQEDSRRLLGVLVFCVRKSAYVHVGFLALSMSVLWPMTADKSGFSYSFRCLLDLDRSFKGNCYKFIGLSHSDKSALMLVDFITFMAYHPGRFVFNIRQLLY